MRGEGVGERGVQQEHSTTYARVAAYLAPFNISKLN